MPPYQDKVDPHEPWRYVCEGCFSVLLRYKPASKTVYCQSCNVSSDYCIDMKTQNVRRVASLTKY